MSVERVGSVSELRAVLPAVRLRLATVSVSAAAAKAQFPQIDVVLAGDAL